MKPAATLKTGGLQTLQDHRGLFRPDSAKKPWSDQTAQLMEPFALPGQASREARMKRTSSAARYNHHPPDGWNNLVKIGNEYTKNESKCKNLPYKTRSNSIPSWSVSDIPDELTNVERHKVKNQSLSKLHTPVETACKDVLASTAERSRRLRSDSLPTLSCKQRPLMPLQRTAVSILSEHRNWSILRSPNFEQNEKNSLNGMHGIPNLPYFDLTEIKKPGEDSSTPATTANCSPATSRCSSSTGKARSVALPRRAMPGMRIPQAAEVFALLDTNGNHFIDVSEWSVFHEIASRGSIFHEILRLLFKAADVHGNGKLDEHEWMEYVAAIVSKIGLQAWEEMAARVTQELNAHEKDPFFQAVRAALGEPAYPGSPK